MNGITTDFSYDRRNRLERVLGEIKLLITVSGEIESSALEIETVGRFTCLDFISF